MYCVADVAGACVKTATESEAGKLDLDRNQQSESQKSWASWAFSRQAGTTQSEGKNRIWCRKAKKTGTSDPSKCLCREPIRWVKSEAERNSQLLGRVRYKSLGRLVKTRLEQR